MRCAVIILYNYRSLWIAPEYLLCLQNGNFDRPNRLFHRSVCEIAILRAYAITVT